MKILSLVIIFLCYQSAKLARMSSVIMTNSIARSTVSMGVASKVIYSYPELRTGILVTRYKRFLADIEFATEMVSASPMTSLDSSSPSSSSSVSSSVSRNTDVSKTMIIPAAVEKVITVVHCPNTGSMYKLIPPHNILPECACSTAADGTKRKYPNTLEMIKENGVWVGINSALANKMVENALNANLIEGCMNFKSLQREVKIIHRVPKISKSKSKSKVREIGQTETSKTEMEESRIDFEISWGDTEEINKSEETGNKCVLGDVILDVNGNTIEGNNETGNENVKGNVKGKGKGKKGSNVVTSKGSLNSNSNKINKKSNMLLEVKSVTLAMKAENGQWNAQFPDSVSTRGQKHLQCLMQRVKEGGAAGILFLIQRDDCTSFSACHLDPSYGPLLHEAYVAGVQILPYVCRLNPRTSSVELLGRVPFVDTYASNSSTDKTVTDTLLNSAKVVVKRKGLGVEVGVEEDSVGCDIKSDVTPISISKSKSKSVSKSKSTPTSSAVKRKITTVKVEKTSTTIMDMTTDFESSDTSIGLSLNNDDSSTAIPFVKKEIVKIEKKIKKPKI